MSDDYTIALGAEASRKNLCLNGEWDIAFDPDNTGKIEGWEREFPTNIERIKVPSVYETVRPFYDGVAWYRTVFEASTADFNYHRLRFGAAQYYAEAWLNGERIGDHEGGMLPFAFDVSNVLRDGANELIVRVIGPPMDREIDGFRCGAPLNQGAIPIAKLGWYFNVAGLWKDVELLSSNDACIADAFLATWPSRDELAIELEVNAQQELGACSVRVEISNWRGGEAVLESAHDATIAAGDSKLKLTVAFPNSRRWSLEDPHLYVAKITLQSGDAQLDEHTVRFGMREFDYIDGEFRLNGQRVVLKGFLHQGDYPRTNLYPDSLEIVGKEMQQVKELGFNFLRCHMRPHYEVLDLADELGVLVEAEPPIGWIENTPETADRCWREIEGLVKNDRNRPSVIMWGLMNEVFHLKGFKPRDMLGLVKQWLRQVHEMDPTRPVIDVSGGHSAVEYGGVGDMLPDTAHQGNVAYMLSASASEPIPITDTHSYHRVPTQDKSWQKFRELGTSGMQVFVSEYGAAQCPPDFDQVLAAYSDADREIGLEDYRMNVDFNESLEQAFAYPWLVEAVGSKKDWTDKTNDLRADDMKLVTLAMRANPRVSGLVFTQLADASGELFGALDTWRNPKAMMRALSEACQDDTVALFPSKRIVDPGETFSLELMLMHESNQKLESWRLKLQDAAGEALQEWGGEIDEANHRDVLFEDKALTLPEDGRYAFHATLTLADGSTRENRVPMQVIARPQLEVKEAAVSGSRAGALAGFLQEAGGQHFPFSNNFREPQRPVLYDFMDAAGKRTASAFEDYCQLRKAIKCGGAAIAFEPEPMALYEFLLPGLIRQRPVMQPNCYITSPEIFAGVSDPGVIDFSCSEVITLRFDRVDDIVALGGKVLYGGLSAHMWTRPATFFHGAALYEIPMGEGTLIICQLPLLERFNHCAASRRILLNLVNYAGSKINNPKAEWLMSRSIDPLPGERFD